MMDAVAIRLSYSRSTSARICGSAAKRARSHPLATNPDLLEMFMIRAFSNRTGQVNRCEGLVLGYGTRSFEHSVAPVGYANFFGPNVESSRAYSVQVGDHSAAPSAHCLSTNRQLQPVKRQTVSRKLSRLGLWRNASVDRAAANQH